MESLFLLEQILDPKSNLNQLEYSIVSFGFMLVWQALPAVQQVGDT